MRCPVCELVSLSVTGSRIPRNEELNKPVWAQYIIFTIYIKTQLRSWTKTTALCQRAEAPMNIWMTARPEGWWNGGGVGWGVKSQSSKTWKQKCLKTVQKLSASVADKRFRRELSQILGVKLSLWAPTFVPVMWSGYLFLISHEAHVACQKRLSSYSCFLY